MHQLVVRSGLWLAGVSLCGAALAENWPQWRGAAGTGISSETGIATKWSKTENVLWRAPLPGSAGATPVVWGDRIFLTSAEGDDLVLLAFNTAGKQLWKQKVGGGNQDARAGEGNSASPSPSTDGKHVWVFFGTGVLGCYTVDGQEVWKFDIQDRYGKFDIQFGLTSTPVLHEGALYQQLIHGPMRRDDNRRTGKVIKLDAATGKEIWAVDRPTEAEFECKHSYASPFIYDDGQQRFLLTHGADCTVAHDLQTGQELWRLSNLNGPTKLNPGQNDPTFRFVASPGFAPGMIVVPTAKAGPTVALKVGPGMAGELSGSSQNIAWVDQKTPDVSIPLVYDGIVFCLQKDGRVFAYDQQTGQELYFERTHTSQHRSSPLLADGHIYFCARDGMCTVLKAGRKFEIVAQNDLGEAITASPVVSNGVLYLRTYDALYAIRGK
jgi:outer membrane protein assembly factor BamB